MINKRSLYLFKTLRQHRHLAEKRSMNYERNKTAKFLVYFMGGFMIAYLIFFAVMFALIANDSESVTSVEFMVAAVPFVLLVDFFFRFLAQQTPSQIVKPYLLHPVPKALCIDTFISTSLFNWGNTIWFAMLLPYALMAVVFSEGIWVTLGFLLFYYLLILANSQWYALCRALISRTMLWWLLPLGVYGVAALPFVVKGDMEKGFEALLTPFVNTGTAIGEGSLLPYIGAMLLLCAVVAVNRRVQLACVMNEVMHTEKATTLRSVNQFAFFDRYGEVGQYLKLEVKSILRNKNPRMGFIVATSVVTLMSVLISLTDVYDGQFMTNFWCVYNFVIYGSMLLTRIMCNEGNYIDCLLVRHENILKLLHAKYIFSSAILLLPFVLMLPTVFSGKWTILMVVAYAVFTAGFQYFILFQLAVYNKQTIPLNTKFVSKNGIENNYWQVLVQLFAFFMPVALISILMLFLSETVAYIIILLIGLAFILTRKFWLRNIYNRMMQRKYELLEGFRSSR